MKLVTQRPMYLDDDEPADLFRSGLEKKLLPKRTQAPDLRNDLNVLQGIQKMLFDIIQTLTRAFRLTGLRS